MTTTGLGAHPGRRSAADGGSRRILLVCPVIPAPPSWGFALRVHHLAVELSQRHRVALLAYTRTRGRSDWGTLPRFLDSFCEVPAPPAVAARRRHQLASLWSGSSYHLGSLRSEAMQKAIDELTEGRAFDVIQVESSAMMCHRFPAHTPVVLDEHNIEYQLLSQVAAIDRSPLRRIYGHLEARKAEREELGSWRRVDGCVATSRLDASVIRSAVPTLATAVVPNAVDTQYFCPDEGTVDPESIVFVGSLNYKPNADAAIWFSKEVLPRIRAARPSATLTVVGYGAPRTLHRLAGRGVVMTGAVGDVRPHVRSAAVVVTPLRAGGGTRLKVLEAMSMEKALVSSTIGSEGIDVTSGEHLIIADDPGEMADQVLRLMADTQLRARLGRAGRELVVERYGWSAAAGRLAAFHAQVMAQTADRMG